MQRTAHEPTHIIDEPGKIVVYEAAYRSLSGCGGDNPPDSASGFVPRKMPNKYCDHAMR